MRQEEPVYRFERKAFITDLNGFEVEAAVKIHPALFREIYHEREINNLYFDSVDFRNYSSNVEGDPERRKARIRWYGPMLGAVSEPVLELKIRSNSVGRKEHYPIEAFELVRGFDVGTLREAIARSDLPTSVRLFLAAQDAKLLNRYTRRYFQSACGRFRITIDQDLVFYSLRGENNSLLHTESDHRTLILEIKYDREHDDAIDEITSRFPFRLTKSSKYAYGIQRLWS